MLERSHEVASDQQKKLEKKTSKKHKLTSGPNVVSNWLTNKGIALRQSVANNDIVTA